MGYLDDIISLSKEITNIVPSREKPRNIADRAQDGILMFQALVSDTIPLNTAATLARVAERVNASFVQGVISLNSTVDISTDRNPVEFLKKYHRNVKLFENSNTVDESDYEQYLEYVSEGKFNAYVDRELNKVFLFRESEEVKIAMNEYSSLLESALSGYKDPNISGKLFREAKDAPLTRSELVDGLLSVKGSDKDRRSEDNLMVPTLLSDTDIKKANDLLPYQMEVKLMAVNDRNEFVQFINFLVGVKVVLHLVRSEEMVTNIHRVVENRDPLFNFLRWTTGEKSLVKDLLLNINGIKLDVANKGRGASPWWSTLKRLQMISSRDKNMFLRNNLSPNATLFLSVYEVEQIEKLYGYNIGKKEFAEKLMNGLFLMSLYIVDDAAGMVKVIYANTGQDFQIISLDALEREITASSNKLGKELLRMISN